MSKVNLYLLILMLVVSTVVAQNPAANNQNILVNSKNIGDDLLLFVPDTAVQILFNPARAAGYGKSFIYTTYNSGYRGTSYSRDIIFQTGDITVIEGGVNYPNARLNDPYFSSLLPTFSLATLFNASNSKWLLTFSNGIRYSDDKDNNSNEDIRSYINSTNERIYRQDNSDNSKILATSVQLSKIKSNYSYGIFAIFNQMEMDYENKSTRYQINSYSNTIHHYDEIRKVNSKIVNNQYKVGISYSQFGKGWDYKTNISYQKSNNQSDELFNLSNSYIDSLGPDSLSNWDVTKRSYLQNGTSYGKNNPDFYQLYNYYQSQIDWLLPKDHFFVSANAVFSPGQIEYNQDKQLLHKEVDNDIYNSTDTSVVFGKGTLNSDNVWLNLSCGYTVSFSLDDIYVMFAINPSYSYTQITDIPFSQQRYINSYSLISLIKHKRTLNKLDVRLPIYLNYSPAKWIDFWGGITYNYGYTNSDEKRSALSRLVTDSGHSTTTVNSHNYNVISSLKSRYLGMNLKHRSGIRLQLAFRNDITNYSYWDLSLGYHF